VVRGCKLLQSLPDIFAEGNKLIGVPRYRVNYSPKYFNSAAPSSTKERKIKWKEYTEVIVVNTSWEIRRHYQTKFHIQSRIGRGGIHLGINYSVLNEMKRYE
jgi:hypothetical protein